MPSFPHKFIRSVIVLALPLALGMAALYHVDSLIEFQKDENSLVRRERSDLERGLKEIKFLEKNRQDLLDRMSVYEQLRETVDNVFISHIPEFSSRIPDDVFIRSVKYAAAGTTGSPRLLVVAEIAAPEDEKRLKTALLGSPNFSDFKISSRGLTGDLSGAILLGIELLLTPIAPLQDPLSEE